MNRSSVIYALGMSLLVLVGCQRKVASGPAAGVSPETMNKVSVVNTDYTYFSAKGKVQSENSGLSANITLRMKKDEVIWASVQKLGFEVARLKITPDSVYMVNKVQNETLIGSFALLAKRYNVDVDFKTLQELLIGNYVPGDAQQEKFKQDGPVQNVRQVRGQLQIDQMIDTTRFKLKRTEVRNLANKDLMTVDYQEFEELNGRPFAKSLLLTIQQPEGNTAKTSIVVVKHNQVSTADSSLDFPFSVPSNYERK
ncbi:DUF4292 domain-containing protein [Rufibacter glacialis]|uniref:DUF4292 domain-containing protein n=1 Tax=Rufibacter glacialis TaxID=1259555 RepID=A0A5M8QFY7_9BACT|nr:DUF4292 domain-containing protein [Rufibacter glacialis]KAA6433332.1 DUF4292 domain-containing protein [Rufibacter glacialis]GGK75342.1 hypothetical protein GCM10011405_24060 [Rufibacter glacialis]